MTFELRYFDEIIDRLSRSPDSSLSRAVQRNVHWGLFSSPETADDSLATFLVAAEAMTARVCRAARVGNSMRILDVGCGFGGTIAHLNEHLTGCELVGLNIDKRQLAIARESVKARPGNSVRFVEGDACELPFGDGEFDVVTAVECIFHFPSRKKFFAHARRVLRPGGTLMVSDFVMDDEHLDELAVWTEKESAALGNFYGFTSKPLCADTYARLARSTGFTVLKDDDITAETMPTYPAINRMFRDVGMHDGEKATRYLEELGQRGFFQYHILSFEAKPR